MTGGTSRKRQSRDGYTRKHDRKKFLKVTNPTVLKKGLGNGLQGILFSCTPRHEDRAFRDAVLLLEKHCEHLPKSQPNLPNEETTQQMTSAASISGGNSGSDETTDISKRLEEELQGLREPQRNLFTRVNGDVNGSVFVCVNDASIDRESLVESALRDAKASGSPHSRHCIRIMPIHTTCYAKKEEAAKAAVDVVKCYFPKIGKKGESVTYAIVFRARLNDGAHRDEYIEEIARAIEVLEPGYKVNLTKPDVVLIVEVLKTSCCIGTFRHYYELAKMNMREAACPSKEKQIKEDSGTNMKSGEQEAEGLSSHINGEMVHIPQQHSEGPDSASSRDAVEDRHSDEKPRAQSVVTNSADADESGQGENGNVKESISGAGKVEPNPSEKVTPGGEQKEGSEKSNYPSNASPTIKE